MNIIASYELPFRHNDQFIQIRGHGYFQVPRLSVSALLNLEKEISTATANQVKDQGLEPAGPIVFLSVTPLESEESTIIS